MTCSRRWKPTLFLGLPVGLALVLVGSPALMSAGQATPSEPVAFTKDIAPILQRSCQGCHHPNALAPMSLMTYDEVRPWAKSIKLRTGLRDKPQAMPPWFVERNIGIQQFKDNMALSEAEIAKIAAWVDNGAPRGNPADMPAPLTFADETKWALGKPDLILSSPPIAVAAAAPDWWGPVGLVPTGLTEDRYVSSLEMREVSDTQGKKAEKQTVGGSYVVHHLVFTTMGPDGKPDLSPDGLPWPVHEVGRNADIFDPDAGRLMRAGSKLLLTSAHLHANGRATNAQIEFGFKFHPKGYQPTKTFRRLTGAWRDLDIKGNEANQRFEAFSTLPENAKMVVFEPHMHAAGVRMCLDAIYGTEVETLNCVGYNHGWVRAYTYTNDSAPLLPKGTILRLTGYFDNTPANRNVADPRNWQGMGHRSIDNMMFDLGGGLYLSDAEYQQELAKRREHLRLTEGQTVIGCPGCAYRKVEPPAPAARVGND